MLVAINCDNFPKIGRVVKFQRNPSINSTVVVQWLQQEKNPTKSRWLRFFKPTGKQPFGSITYSDILL